MRIISGKFKGITLFGPIDKKIRPLKDMVRESIFNFLDHSNKISFNLENSNILDLYSGSGSFGLECLSRNSNKVIFIENKNEAIKILEKNVERLKITNQVKIFPEDVFLAIQKNSELFFSWLSNANFNLIFCDPPFKNANINELIELIAQKNLLNKNGIIIIHRHKKDKVKLKNNFKVVDERIYGLSKIIFGKII